MSQYWDYIVWDEWRMVNWKGLGRKWLWPNQDTATTFSWGEWKIMKSLSQGSPAEIWTQLIPNTSLEHYLCIGLSARRKVVVKVTQSHDTLGICVGLLNQFPIPILLVFTGAWWILNHPVCKGYSVIVMQTGIYEEFYLLGYNTL
jgi:hypothetical protein